MAIGAARINMMRMVLKQGSILAIRGIVVGITGSVGGIDS
jgi:hypothetical protein